MTLHYYLSAFPYHPTSIAIMNMDEKRRLQPGHAASRRGLPRRRSVILSILALVVLYLTVPLHTLLPIWLQSEQTAQNSESNRYTQATRPDSGLSFSITGSEVGLEAFVMSKCPDARDCLRDLVVPAMEQISDLVNFKLSIIGSIDETNSTSDIQCKHGPEECLGDIILLCAQHLYPTDAKISLGFSNCLISSYKKIPDRSLIESCALEHAVDFAKLNHCLSDDGHGEELLRASVLRSKSEGVVYSCTVKVGGEKWCIRDGGRWKGCVNGSSVDALVAEIRGRSQSDI